MQPDLQKPILFHIVLQQNLQKPMTNQNLLPTTYHLLSTTTILLLLLPTTATTATTTTTTTTTSTATYYDYLLLPTPPRAAPSLAAALAPTLPTATAVENLITIATPDKKTCL